MAKIKLEDTLIDTMLKMSEGNPGAITVITEITLKADAIDPQDAFGFFGTLMHLDTLEIYGSDIWILFKDICNMNLARMIAVLRACQLGIINPKVIKDAIESETRIDLSDTMQSVVDRLNQFDKSCLLEQTFL